MMADFKTAIDWMKQGKKVTREAWDKDYYLEEGHSKTIINSDGPFVNYILWDIEATDWVLFEEHFDLSKKIITKFDTIMDESADSIITTPIDVVRVKHIKEFIKQLKRTVDDAPGVGMIECAEVISIIDKLTGERFK